MCTIFDGAPIPRLAEKNIVAYKVLERTKVKHAWETNIYDYNTPYRMMVVQFDMEYVQDQSCEFPSTKRRHGKTSVHGGAFHLFVRKKDADIEKNTLKATYDRDYIVVKAIIPEGACYAEGTCEYGETKCYVTKRVIYKK